MKKIFGWVLFLLALGIVAITWYNLTIAPWKNDINALKVLPYIAVWAVSIFGWYKLAIRKTE